MYAKAKAAAANAAAKAAKAYAEGKSQLAASTSQTIGSRTPGPGAGGRNNSSSDPFADLGMAPPSYDAATGAQGGGGDAPAPTVNLDDLLSGAGAPAVGSGAWWT